MKKHYTYDDFIHDCEKLINIINTLPVTYKAIYGVPRGGVPVAIYLKQKLQLDLIEEDEFKFYKDNEILVVDDIIDSGSTRLKYVDFDFACLVIKERLGIEDQIMGAESKTFYGHVVNPNKWVVFPWEQNESTIQECVVRILEHIGEDPLRNGLIDTPSRVEKMYNQLFRGYDKKRMPKVTTFPNQKDTCEFVNSLIIDKGYFFSYCEHHMVPFFGQYYFGYIPNCEIIGASKIARIIDYYAAKLQIQERLAIEVVNLLEEVLEPSGIILMLRARHLCKEMRGVQKYNSPFETIEARGWLLENRNGSKDEFIARCGVPNLS